MTLRRREYLVEAAGKKTKQKQAINLVKNLLIARRNNNIKQEQAAYNKLLAWCDKNNFEMENVIDGVTNMLRKSPAAIAQGWV